MYFFPCANTPGRVFFSEELGLGLLMFEVFLRKAMKVFSYVDPIHSELFSPIKKWYLSFLLCKSSTS